MSETDHEIATNRGGAPIGNRNSLRHGLRAGRLPPKCSYIRRMTDDLRRHLENDVLNRRGAIDTYAAALIQSAIRHERRCLLLQRWLRDENETLAIADRMRILADVSAATESRDRCLRHLGLDRTAEHDFWDDFYSHIEQTTPDDQTVANTTGDATGANLAYDGTDNEFSAAPPE